MTTETKQTRLEAARMVADVLADGSRIDRVLQVSDDGEYYTTTDADYIRDGVRFSVPHVRIPVGCGCSDDDMTDWAFALLAEMDEAIEAAQ